LVRTATPPRVNSALWLLVRPNTTVPSARGLVPSPSRPLTWSCRRSKTDGSHQPKEFDMNEALQLEVVDLGDAKQLTKGALLLPVAEDNPARPTKQAI
jgi:hypothetical protein